MSRRGREEEDEEVEEVEEEEGRGGRRSRGGGGKGSGVASFIDDAASEDKDEDDDDEEEEEEEEDDDEDEDYEGGRGGRPSKRKRSILIDDMAQVDDDDEEEDEDEYEEGFIDDDARADNPDEDVQRGSRRHFNPNPMDDADDMENLAEMLKWKYRTQSHSYYDEEGLTEVEQQALLPSVKDPKLWMVKCAIGHERETAICLMQKFIDRQDLQIKSAVALEHLKNYIYVEAEKEAHVKEACKGLRNIFSSAKILLVPTKEMTDVLSVKSKSADLSRDTWIRLKLGIYKGDLAKVVDVDDVLQKVTVKLIPRLDLQALTDKLKGLKVAKKKSFVPPPRLFSTDEAREMNIPVERRRDRDSGEYFEMVGGLKFEDGFLRKKVSIKSISTQNVTPSLDELEKFGRVGDDVNEDVARLSTLNRKKGHFIKGDAVVVVKGDLKDLRGYVEKVEDSIVHIRPKQPGLPKTLAFSEKDLCKYFNPGDHVKVVFGVQEGVTGMVVKVEGHVLTILSDTSKEHIRVFADHVVESSEVTTGLTRIGDYELHDLVLLDNLSFGVIVRVESEAFQVLKGVPDKPEVVLVKLREIKYKLDRRVSVKDCKNNTVSTKDIVRVIEGRCKGKQGPVEHIHKGICFIHDRHHLEHSGFICAKAQSCVLVGGSVVNSSRMGVDTADPRLGAFRSPARILQSPGGLPPRGPYMNSGGRFGGGGRGGRGHDALVSRCIKIKSGPYKGYRGHVKEVNGALVRVELDSLMKIVTVKREDLADTANVATPFRETPMHPSRTPLYPIQTPMREPGATPICDGSQTPMHNQAWAPMSPPRDNQEDGNRGTWGAWGSSPAYQPGTPVTRPFDAPTPGSGWENTSGTGFGDAPFNAPTPGSQPMTPIPASYLPGTPGGQPMTPGNAGMDVMSPMIGDECGSNWILPDVLVSVSRGEGSTNGVVKEALLDGSYRVALGSSGSGDEVTALPDELEIIRPKKSDRVKIMNGAMRGVIGRLIGVDGSDVIVRVEGSLELKIVDLGILGKLAT
ncbi:putative transcription elongation factor SPT5 homolog 1 isoform X2 [Hordeum vulgare subsp. vulgare]|uniref:putative transcription elongation factor SPT5 homolog 1 isoform X2 n=1 Tax=Hordeum vulgare subsp. vulgare TaxID=112509 RepID=UPI001D1A48FE|nr:putative transcription elongation factor SPT5 homolog 1 isoform X2 [Hordeum vulgare subsp. vulgare]